MLTHCKNRMVKVLVLLQQYQKGIGSGIAILFYVGIGIGNTFFKVYLYWYC